MLLKFYVLKLTVPSASTPQRCGQRKYNFLLFSKGQILGWPNPLRETRLEVLIVILNYKDIPSFGNGTKATLKYEYSVHILNICIY